MCAVSYLNTVPLVWGLQHSPNPELRDTFDLRFALPSACADQLATGQADIGIVPVIEMARQGLEYFPGTGIACHGPVRSILLISKVPFKEIRVLATDAAGADEWRVVHDHISVPADLAHGKAAMDLTP